MLNGNFEYYAEGNVNFPYKTSIRWTNTRGYIVDTSTYAPTSNGTSGIISTGDENYTKLLDTTVGTGKLSDYLKVDDVTFNPHSPYYYGYTEEDTERPESSAKSEETRSARARFPEWAVFSSARRWA